MSGVSTGHNAIPDVPPPDCAAVILAEAASLMQQRAPWAMALLMAALLRPASDSARRVRMVTAHGNDASGQIEDAAKHMEACQAFRASVGNSHPWLWGLLESADPVLVIDEQGATWVAVPGFPACFRLPSMHGATQETEAVTLPQIH